jgi:hypothetical protein
MRGDDKFTRSVHCIIFIITGGRIPSIKEMTTDESGLRSTSNNDPKDVIMSSKMWEKHRIVSMGRFIEHTSIYGTNVSDDENAESMMKTFVNLSAEVMTQGVLRIHEEIAKCFCVRYFKDSLEEKDSLS